MADQTIDDVLADIAGWSTQEGHWAATGRTWKLLADEIYRLRGMTERPKTDLQLLLADLEAAPRPSDDLSERLARLAGWQQNDCARWYPPSPGLFTVARAHPPPFSAALNFTLPSERIVMVTRLSWGFSGQSDQWRADQECGAPGKMERV